MSPGGRVLLGIGAAPGRAIGRVRRVEWDIPPVVHRTISPSAVEPEVARLCEARDWASERIRRLHDEIAERLGDVEAKIFEAQILMLEDPDIIDGAISYIRENYLSAERAFDWRITEIRTRILEAAHLIIVDRLADLRDIRFRVLSRLQGADDDPLALPDEPAVLVFQDLTPSLAVRLDPERVLGLITGTGTRSAHSAVLARSMRIPAVVGVGAALSELPQAATVLLDGATGKIVIDPSETEVESHRRMMDRLTDWTERVSELSRGPLETADGVRVRLRANLDQPDDVAAAMRVGAEGVGLFRSEFLVIGRRVIPGEREQYAAYRRVAEAFPDDPVTLRTFDIGGDKFPLFLEMPPEENPYLGWRAIRVCLDLPDLFRNQLRAAVRAGQGHHMRILLPFIINVDEVLRTRELLREVTDSLDGPVDPVSVGIMLETPAAAGTLDLLAPHVDFISLGSNDLTQYALAVDRGNARLAGLADPMHPAMVRLYASIRSQAAEVGLDTTVCGDLATDPIGISLLLGLGYRDFSLPPSALPEIRELVRAVSVSELRRLCRGLDSAEEVGRIKGRLADYLQQAIPYETASVGP